MCGFLSHVPYQGPGLQPRHVPWLGIEPVILWFTGQYSIQWATPVRAESFLKKTKTYNTVFINCLFCSTCILSPKHLTLKLKTINIFPLEIIHLVSCRLGILMQPWCGKPTLWSCVLFSVGGTASLSLRRFLGLCWFTESLTWPGGVSMVCPLLNCHVPFPVSLSGDSANDLDVLGSGKHPFAQ